MTSDPGNSPAQATSALSDVMPDVTPDAISGAMDTDTIVAVATAPGRGGVGVVRLSGPAAFSIAQKLCRARSDFSPRLARYSRFFDASNTLLDTGLCIAFPGPASFTGEDVVELQGHGSPVAMDALVRAAIAQGARMARPGEFSERAYLNGKMDLAQAEAVADLINAASDAAAKAAVRSLQGDFSKLLNQLAERLLDLRVQVEAAIDFPDEDIEILAAPGVTTALAELRADVAAINARTKTGVRLTEGARLVLVGAPNVGKSSVLNRLCGEERAIVTAVPGTTRDVLREQLVLDGIPVELVDTAGLRDTDDLIEAEGVRRARAAAAEADLVLAVHDLTEPATGRFLMEFLAGVWGASESEDANNLTTERSVQGLEATSRPDSSPLSTPLSTHPRTDGPPLGAAPALVVIGNKRDLVEETGSAGVELLGSVSKQALTISSVESSPVSARTGAGMEQLTERLVGLLTQAPQGGSAAVREQAYSARSRHLLALDACGAGLAEAADGIEQGQGAELVAEHLRHAQGELGSVCGEISSDQLLGEIFSSFCIGK